MDEKKDCIESILFQFDQWVKHREVQDYFEGERCCILADDLYDLKQSVENGTISKNKEPKIDIEERDLRNNWSLCNNDSSLKRKAVEKYLLHWTMAPVNTFRFSFAHNFKVLVARCLVVMSIPICNNLRDICPI